jgi:hypothetical protein
VDFCGAAYCTDPAGALPGLRMAPGHTTRYQPNIAFRAHRALPVVVA